jgi:hypothetical protein
LESATALLVLKALSMLALAEAPLLAEVPCPSAQERPAFERLLPWLLSFCSLLDVLLSVLE